MRKLTNNKLFMIVLVLPFLEPRGISAMSSFIGGIWRYVDLLFTVNRYLSLVLILALSWYEVRKPSVMFGLITAYELWIVIVSLLRGNLTSGIIMTAISVIGLSIVTDFYSQRGKLTRLLEVISAILGVIIVINLISIVLYPKGMYTDDRGWWQNHILGYKNLHIYIYLPFFGFYTIYKFLTKGKLDIQYYIMIFIVALSSVLVGSSTTILSIALLIILIVLFMDRNLWKWINIRNAFIVGSVVSILFILFDYQQKLSFITEFLFHKDATFTRRTLVWGRSLLYIADHPLLGNGNLSFNISGSFNWTITQVHNQYLDIVVMGGIVLFAIFLLIVFITSKKVASLKSTKLRNTMLFLFITYFVVFITEGRRDNVLLFMCFSLAYNINYIAAIGQNVIEKKGKKRRRIRFVLRRR